MKTSSAKAKGRRACQEAKELMLKSFPILECDDIQVTSSGATGEDLRLSPVARALLKLVIECKNVESLNIWKALAQAEAHGDRYPECVPTVIFKRNKSKLYIAMGLEHYLYLFNLGVDRRLIQNRLKDKSLALTADEEHA